MRTIFGTLIRDQRIGFLAVGALNTIVGFLVFSALTLWVFHDLQFGYLLSLVISYAVGIVLAFWLYRRFVFKVRGHAFRDFARFVTVYLLSIGINLVALPALVEVAGLSPLLAQAAILVATTLVSFFGHKSFSFRRSASEETRDSASRG